MIGNSRKRLPNIEAKATYLVKVEVKSIWPVESLNQTLLAIRQIKGVKQVTLINYKQDKRCS